MLRRLGRVLALSLVLGGAHAAVAGEPSELERARAYFNVGVRAYDAGQFNDAIQAFQQAYKITPRDGLLFSLAQAHRKQFYVGKKPDDLRAAVKYYHDYLDRVPRGGRRADAADALAELEPLAAKLSGEATVPAPAPEQKAVTQLMISSLTPGVRVEIDGRAAGKLPLVADVQPGRHRVRLFARGYRDYTRAIDVLAGSTVPLDVPLEDEPGRLTIRAPTGAHVSVDGNLVGTAPIGTVLLAPGRHFVAVTANGRRAFTRGVELARGKSVSVEAPLASSPQRTAAWVFLGAGASGVVVSGALALAAYSKQKDAQTILDRRASENISPADRDSYGSLRDARDSYRTLALISGGVGLGLATAGLVLYAFDEPHVTPPAPAEERRPSAPAPGVQLEVSALPAIGPQGAGAALFGRF